ncbi:MAG: type IX secretion system plug protein domain-containing protein [Bacteroidales bacterium]
MKNNTIEQKWKFILFSLFSLIFINISRAQDIPEGIDFSKNQVFKDNIQTVLLHPKGFDLAEPIIELNAGQLRLAFDDFSNDVKNYRYTIVHCDHKWNQSQINSFEYLQGFEENDIQNYKFSRNTSYEYIHYEALFPNRDIQITKTGNYALLVYDETLNKNNLIFLWQFSIYQNKIKFDVQLGQSRLSAYRKTHQELKVNIYTQNVNIDVPERSIFMVVQQNNRQDNIIKGLQPRLFLDNIIYYDRDNEILFQGGNESREFDLRSLTNASGRTKRIVFDNNTGYHVYLWEDKSRNHRPYLNDNLLNGRKSIATEQRFEANYEGDYAWVHFFIPWKVPLPESKVYIIGGVNDWNLDYKSEMFYDFKRKGYADSLFVKQGYYNYLYGVVEKGKKKADIEFFEGSHFETKNDYKILIYYRQPGTIYDQLIGYEYLETP